MSAGWTRRAVWWRVALVDDGNRSCHTCRRLSPFTGNAEVSVALRELARVVARRALVGATGLAVGYLALRAAFSWVPPVGWFGNPQSVATLAIVAALLTALCVFSYRNRVRERPGTTPLGGVLGILAATSGILAFSSYARCSDAQHPPFFTPLLWTASTIRGGGQQQLSAGQPCPRTEPVGLEIARVAGNFALYLTFATIAIALLTAQMDRVRVRYARSVTAIVDFDEDAGSMVTAVARTQLKKSRLALIVGESKLRNSNDLRALGANIITINLERPELLASLPLWKKLDKLYLLSPSATTNLRRLAAIEEGVASATKKRLPLIVRIDDPWQAEAWRSQQLGGSDTRWAADAVGIYEVTATRILDRIIGTGRVTRIIVCGTSPLTLALCANLGRRRLEASFYTAPGTPPLPALTIVANNAEEYRDDHKHHQQQLGLPSTDFWLDAEQSPPSLPKLAPIINSSTADRPAAAGTTDAGTTDAGTTDQPPAGTTDQSPSAGTTDGLPADGTVDQPPDGTVDQPPTAAVIFAAALGGQAGDATLATRLAARYPTLAIFVLDPKADAYQHLDVAPVAGQLYTFRLAMDMPEGQAQDTWERAAMLMHERYAAQAGHDSEATKPWAELSEFYRGSNRRTVRNALWMVEETAGHTWDTFGGPPDPPVPSEAADSDPWELMRAIGFDHDTAMAMAKAEHEDWARYLRKNGWSYGPQRDNKHRRHPRLVSWDVVQADPEGLLRTAVNSVATTLYALRELGYRSRPLWQRFSRTGMVTAKRRWTPWSWTSESGGVMHASAGDWEISDGHGRRWSVRDDAFRVSYRRIGGNRWERTGVVFARSASDGETIASLEGATVAAAGDWVIRGTRGEEWVVPGDKFAGQYMAISLLDAEESADPEDAAEARDSPAAEAVDSA